MLKILKPLFGVCLGLLLLVGCHAQPENYYTGTVESDQYNVMGPLSGEIVQIHVEEGDSVQVGQVVASLDTDALDIEINRLKAVLAGAGLNSQDTQGAREESESNSQQIEQQKTRFNSFKTSSTTLLTPIIR